MKLRSHLALLIVAALLPALLFAGGLLWIVSHQQAQAVARGLADTAEALASAVDREIAVSTAALQAFSTSRVFDEGDFAEAYRRAAQVRAAHPEWRSVFLTDAAGQEIFTLIKPFGAALPNVGAEQDILHAMRSQRPHVSNLLLGSVSGHPVVRVHVPVVRDGRLRYLITATLSPASLAAVLQQDANEHEAVTTVVDRNGVAVARTRDAERWVGRRLPSAMMPRTTGPSIATTAVDGRHEYVAAKLAARSGFTVLVAVPASAVSVSLQQPVWLLTGIAAVTLIAALVVSTLLARRIARPILGLATDVNAIGSGEPAPAARRSGLAEVDVVQHALVDAARTAEDRAVERERRVAAESAHEREQTLRATAEDANRRKDEFLAMLGHELRNPLGAMTSAMAVLDRPDAPPPGAARARAILARQMRHLTKILDDLLDIGRITTGKITLHREPVDVRRVVERAVEQVAARHDGIRRRIAFRGEPAWALADVTRLDQVVTNLLTNALKYTPAEAGVEVSVRADADAAVVEVRDEGVGIAPEILPHVFDLFFQADRTADRSQGGLGIGLTLVKRLVELHGGRIEARSEGLGRGSTFTVRLPRRATTPAAVAPTAGPAAEGTRHRILLIEDNDDAREMLRCTLEMAGHEVYEAADGAAGVALAAKVQPSIAIVDLGLPGLDGCDVAREIRRRPGGEAIVLIALSGYGQPDDRRRTDAAGFATHLVKPADAGTIEAAIAAAAGERAS